MRRERTGTPTIGNEIDRQETRQEKKGRLGRQFVMDLAIALNSVIQNEEKLSPNTSCAFISEELAKLADSLSALSDEEKEGIKTRPAAIQSWLDGRTNPTPEKFTAIRQLLIKSNAPIELIPEENFFH